MLSKVLLQAVKIALGCCLSIWIAETMQLEYAASAGSITFLSVITTRWESLRLMGARLAGFVVAAFLAWLIFRSVPSRWAAFGLFIFLLALATNALGWKPTLAVNVVIGTHFLAKTDFSAGFVLNELLLVVVGTTVGFCVNFFQNNALVQRQIRREIASVDRRMQKILGHIARELKGEKEFVRTPFSENVWEETVQLERHLQKCLVQSYEYRDNHFASHPEYYSYYFEMRIRQCAILSGLQGEIRRIRQFPVQAGVVAEFVVCVGEHVLERNEPAEQLERLNTLLEEMKQTPLPRSREEFENRAILYHILMDLEEFLKLKKKFVDLLTAEQLERYWGKTKEKNVKVSE